MSHIVIIGGGAAGLMAACFAAGAPHEVTLLERMGAPGRKILIAGGGRCNVLPSEASAEQFHTSSSRHALRAILGGWPLPEQRAFFEETLALPLRLEPETGKLFPASNRASDVRDSLLRYALGRGARLRTEARVEGIERAGESWTVCVAGQPALHADRVILATGGLSVPKTGSDGLGLRLADAMGHAMHPTYPALTPLLCNEPRHHALAGLSLTVTLMAPRGGSLKKGEQTTGGFLFTHRGYSGPAVLDLSHHATQARGERPPLWVQWEADEPTWEARLLGAPATAHVRTLLRERLPQRLADLLIEEAALDGRTMATLRREERRHLLALLTRYPLPYTGDEGYQKAEVTGGGVALTEVNPRTMESRRQPGLFLCGEMLDAFGPIGGYNFLWAWATGRLAGEGARA